LIVKTPINPPKPTDKVDPTRDRMTGLPLDDKGRYTVNVALGDPVNGYANYSPKFLPCATPDCIRTGKNLDMSDSSTQAYVKALDAQVFKDINTAGTVGTLLTPVGVAGNTLGILGPLTSIAAGFMEDKFTTTFAKEGLQLAAASYLKTVYGVSDAIANRITATVDLAGGWQAFIDRMKSEIEKGSK
jgi:filamentous hemagglutinin